MLRRLLFTIASLLAIVDLAAASEPKLVLLGTGGRPTPKRTRSAPAQATQIEDSIYVPIAETVSEEASAPADLDKAVVVQDLADGAPREDAQPTHGRSSPRTG